MIMETIGEAWHQSLRISARCAAGRRDGMKSIRPCIYSYEPGSAHADLDARSDFSALDARLAFEMPQLRIARGDADNPNVARAAECRRKWMALK